MADSKDGKLLLSNVEGYRSDAVMRNIESGSFFTTLLYMKLALVRLSAKDRGDVLIHEQHFFRSRCVLKSQPKSELIISVL